MNAFVGANGAVLTTDHRYKHAWTYGSSEPGTTNRLVFASHGMKGCHNLILVFMAVSLQLLLITDV